jgi:predicted enzyme related to lactoylglutathione lyase
MPSARLSLIEFPADDSERARRFWEGLLGAALDDRAEGEGSGRQTHGAGPAVGVHERGRGPGDTASLPYFAVEDMTAALERVRALGGEVIHPGAAWSVCRDSEGTPFGLAAT